MEELRDTLGAACQVAGLVAAVLLLPSALIDLAFDTDIVGNLLQAALAAFAVALIATVWKVEHQKQHLDDGG
jgi:hypothetical protein